MAWNYSEQEYQNSKITIPAGKHRVRIAQIVPKMSKTQKNMYEIVLDVSGHAARLFDYLVFMPDNAQMTNGKIGSIVHSFGVTGQLDPTLVPAGWVGAVGACTVKLDEENRSKVGYYIEKEKAAELPAWKEPERKLGFDSNSDNSMFSGSIPPPPAPPANTGMYLPPMDDSLLPF